MNRLAKLKTWFRGKHIPATTEELFDHDTEHVERFNQPMIARVLTVVWRFWLRRWPILLPIIVAAIVALFIHFDSKSTNNTSNNEIVIESNQTNTDEKEKSENTSLIEDARVVAGSIVITGWETTGDYIGYIGQLVGFYEQHKDKYGSEYELYRDELKSAQELIKLRRAQNKSLSIDEKHYLRGLVQAGEDHLEKMIREK